jgi:hypothetical protein
VLAGPKNKIFLVVLVIYFYFLDTLKEIWNRIIYQRWNGDIDACSAEIVQVDLKFYHAATICWFDNFSNGKKLTILQNFSFSFQSIMTLMNKLETSVRRPLRPYYPGEHMPLTKAYYLPSVKSFVPALLPGSNPLSALNNPVHSPCSAAGGVPGRISYTLS